MTRIRSVETELVRVPQEEPVGLSGGPPVESFLHVVVTLRTDDGLEGTSYVFSTRARAVPFIQRAVEDLAEQVVGEQVGPPQRLWQKLWAALGAYDHGGPAVSALTALDVGLWDLWGKALGQPVYRLLGGLRQRVPTYASQGLWRGYSIDRLQRNAADLVAKGFRAMKLRLAGEGDDALAVERVRRVREAIGPDIALMVDVNFHWTVPQAIRVGRRIQEFDLTWLEDPVPARDIAGCARVAAALDVPIATGEAQVTRYPFLGLIQSGAADIPMVDLQRLGGISEWPKVAALAEAFGLPVVPHLLPEFHRHVAGALPNLMTVEYMPWSFALLKNPPQPASDGCLEIPETPGLGIELDRAAIARWRV